MRENVDKFACVLAFCGESGSGKSTIAGIYRDCLQEQGIRAEFATKYISGRSERENEDPDVKIVDSIPEGCIKGSPRKGQEIGYDLQEIRAMICEGVFPIVVTKDVKFLATLATLLNPEKDCDTMKYEGRELPVVRMRIYDVRSVELSNDELTSLTKQRHPDLSQQELEKEAKARTTSWQPYYHDRFGCGDMMEQIVNFREYEFMKKYISKHVIGELNENENTLLGYVNLWKENPACNNTGVILGKYGCIASDSKEYLKKQNVLDSIEKK